MHATTTTPVCRLEDVPRGGGVAALVDGHQVALLRTDDGAVHALDNRDPFTGANVLARGIVGTHGGVATVASPLRKQRFDLATGVCLDDEHVRVGVHDVVVVDEQVHVRHVPHIPHIPHVPVAGDAHDTAS